MPKRKIPTFATEAEEAAWWYKNRRELDRDFVDAARKRSLKRLDNTTLAARAAASRVISIRLPEPDLARARRQAAKKGLPYQTYIKSLPHQALEKDSNTSLENDPRFLSRIQSARRSLRTGRGVRLENLPRIRRRKPRS